MTLRLKTRCRRGSFLVDVDLSCSESGTTCFFGASGSGKTTLLRVLAGHEKDALGIVQVGDQLWQDSSRNVFVPPHRRGVGWVSQETDLFQHLSVADNLAFGGSRVRGRPTKLSHEDVVAWLKLEPFLSRMPDQLSGGQQQRVAIGRALLSSPRLLVLDEPMSALDTKARLEILPYIDTLRRELAIPIIYVSHSLREVARLADHVVCLDDGRVVQEGGIHELSARPEFAAYQAADQGAVVDAQVSAHDEDDHLSEVITAAGPLWLPRNDLPVGADVRLQIFARDVSIATQPVEHDSILNVLEGTVSQLEEVASGVFVVRIECGEGEKTVPLLARLTARSRRRLAIETGSRVFARMKSVSLLD